MNKEVVITGTGVLSPFGMGVEAFTEGYRAGRSPMGQAGELSAHYYPPRLAAAVPDYDAKQYLNAKGIRGLDKLTVHVSVALDFLHDELGFGDLDVRRQHYADERVAITLGTTGPIQSILDFDLETVRDPQFVQPGLFPNTVFPLPASYAAIRRSIKASCVTLTNGETSSLDAFSFGARQIADGRVDFAIVGGAEELTPAQALAVGAIHRERGGGCPVMGEGAALFGLESAQAAGRRGAQPLASLLAVHTVFCPDLAAGAAECWSRIKRLAPANDVASIAHVFLNREIDLASFGLDAARVVHPAHMFGYLGALNGAMGVLSALVDPAIPSGAPVLVVNLSEEGNCTMLLLKKWGAEPVSSAAYDA